MKKTKKMKQQYQKAWKASNPKKVLAYSRAAYKRNKHSIKYRYYYFKKQAQKTHRKVEISLQCFTLLTRSGCYYCGTKVVSTGSGLDRIDSNKGYLIDNVVTCCHPCNWMKRNLSVKDFLAHIRRIISHGIFIGEW